MEYEQIVDTPTLNTWMEEHNLQGYWAREPRDTVYKPFLWKWQDIERAIVKAAEVVPIEQAFRRNIALRNPRNSPGTMTTVTMGVQCVLPGEVAPAHRHSAAAFRFVIQGDKNAFVMADGEPMPMEEGDFLTNPHWTFHGHINKGDRPVIWIDSLDVKIAHLGHEFREDYPELAQDAGKSIGHGLRLMGHAKPAWLQPSVQPPPFRYPWSDTSQTLAALKDSEVEPDAHDGYHVTFQHPLTGGPTTPTIAAEMQLLPAGFRGKSHRHNSTIFYQVFRGSGLSVVDGEKLSWSKGDFFFVPPWAEHHHESSSGEDAILYSVCDWPTMKSLGLYEEER
jgi:gentisate 1,2-dioxygenase